MKKGDKYIIEIEEVHTHYNGSGKPYPLARIKGFSTLVFDEKGLSMLEKVEEPQEKFLNCWFVVTEDTRKRSYIGAGKIIRVENGKFLNDGTYFPFNCKLKTKEELIDYMWERFSGVRIAILEGYDDAST